MRMLKSTWLRDALIVSFITIFATTIFFLTDAYKSLHKKFEAYDGWEVGELFLGAGVLTLLLVWYSVRRLVEVNKVLRLQTKTQENLRKKAEELSFLVSASPGVFYIAEAGGDYNATYISPTIKDQLGYTPEEYTGDSSFWLNHVHPDDKQKASGAMERLLKDGRITYDYRFRHKNGTYRWMHDQLALSRNKKGKYERFVGFWVDITDRKNLELDLKKRVHESTKNLNIANQDLQEEVKLRRASELAFKKMAETDALTKLPNRVVFGRSMESVLEQTRKTKHSACVILLDLDQFKHINDTLGHRLGDILLCEAARRLSKTVRHSDVVARLGGDEFAIIMPDFVDISEVEDLAKRVSSEVSTPYDLEGQVAYSSASMGIIIVHGDEDSPEVIFQNADIALYESKRKGGKCFTFYDENLSVGVNSRREIEIALRRAMKNNCLALHYQPQIDITTGRIYGTEALLRWNHPEWGMVSPAKFIPVAEQTRLIIPIGEWVIKEACRQNKAWQDQGLPPIIMAVNVSPLQLMHHDVLGSVQEALAATGLDPQWLEIEITESVASESRSIEKLQALRDIGVNLAIDDFGTGYSSLGRLQNFPVNRLKIDQSFVRGLGREGNNGSAIEAIVRLGHGLSMNVIAEGVETLEEMETLKEMNCDEVQGFLFSPALPPEVFANFHEASTPNRSLPKIMAKTREDAQAGQSCRA